MEVVHESADSEADVIFGTTTDEDMPLDAIRITLVATGFEKELNKGINNEAFISTETPASQPAAYAQPQRPKMVVGGDLSDDYLDVPTYMRQQKD